MEDAIPNYFNEPLLIQSATKSRFTQIAVHAQVAAADGQRYDVIFLGTGTLFSYVRWGIDRSAEPSLIELPLQIRVK